MPANRLIPPALDFPARTGYVYGMKSVSSPLAIVAPPAEAVATQSFTPPDWRALLAHQPLFFTVTSDSMQPDLQPGDEVEVTRVASPSAGEVLVYMESGRLVVHRYLGYGIFRGDNRLGRDRQVLMEQVIGRVTRVRRQGVLHTLNKPNRREMWQRRFRLYRTAAGKKISRIRQWLLRLWIKSPPPSAKINTD